MTTPPDTTPAWMKDWTQLSTDTTEPTRPPWVVDIDKSIVSGDRALGDLADLTSYVATHLSSSDRIQLALAHYQRATAAALAEAALHAESKADALDGIKSALEVTSGRVDDIASDMADVGNAAAKYANRRRWWSTWLS